MGRVILVPMEHTPLQQMPLQVTMSEKMNKLFHMEMTMAREHKSYKHMATVTDVIYSSTF